MNCEFCGEQIGQETVYALDGCYYHEECFDENTHEILEEYYGLRKFDYDDEPDYMERGHAELEDMLLEKENDR